MASLRRLRGKLGGRLRDWQRGATGVEYALLVSLVVVIAVSSLDYIENANSDQVREQADCVETRPPPVACQLSAVTTTSSSAPSSSSSSSSTPPTPPVVPSEGTVTPPAPPTVTDTGSSWEFRLDLEVTAPASGGGGTTTSSLGGPDPGVAGATIKIRFTVPGYPQFNYECITDLAGQCSVSLQSIPDNLPNPPGTGPTVVTYEIMDVDSTPPTPGPYPSGSVTEVG
jgi:Flp pilus assembly pilin Flp